MKKRKIGIVGGMGPIAGLEMAQMFYNYIKVDRDSQYPSIIIVNYTDIPSRTRSFLFGEIKPTARITEIIEELFTYNITDILLACNSAHYYIDNYHFPQDLTFWNIIENTSRNVLKLKLRSYVILGGEVTVYGGLYDKYLATEMESIKYSKELFLKVRSVIDQVKSNRRDDDTFFNLLSIVNAVVSDQNNTVIILACTELTFFKKQLGQNGYNVIDSMEETVLNCINDIK